MLNRSIGALFFNILVNIFKNGRLAEWFKAAVSKAVGVARLPKVRILHLPPNAAVAEID